MNGGWSGWSAWSGCAAGICAGNQRIRTRTCTNPVPSEDGKYCDEGDSSEQKDCMSKFNWFMFDFIARFSDLTDSIVKCRSNGYC